jgi:plasmid stabilization system protein ParE
LEQIREVIEGNYRIIYYVGLDQVDVLAIIHGGQNLSPNQQNEP